ncbi:uncharacterized protein LOC121390706 [Gigantopelta aegis]|uniref:uncharacterized protein LOC121390706 n=1 Tax=Gigantopelta aegis TaxID=1735272 RepID=UPI001B88D61F|nr:uncharacterized protein LOC121390706 [Gigantopelta aegis]
MMSQMLPTSDAMTELGDSTLRSCSSDRLTVLRYPRTSSSSLSQNGQVLDSHEQTSPDGPGSQNQLRSSQEERLSVAHDQVSSDGDGQSPVFQNQWGHGGPVFQGQPERQLPVFNDQTTSPQDEQLPSFPSHSQESSSKNNQSSNDDQAASDVRSSLQEELAALRSFKVPSKRTELTLQEKVDLLNHSEGKSQRQLAQMFGIGKSQVQTILKRRPEILKAYEQNCVSDRKRFGKRAENDDVNKLTWEWFQEMSKTQGMQVNGPMLQDQAKQYAKQLGRNDFKASNGWLASFRKRHNILSSEQGLSTQEPTKISSWKDNLKRTMSKYNFKDILCLTEVHLNYASLPEKVKAAFSKRKGENPDHCLTVMLWYNMLGDFDTPVVIGRHPWQPHCGVDESDMPVIWRWNSNAWVSADIFQEWVRALDRKFQQQGRHVLLFLEHTSVHFLDLQLEHVKFVFHPSNSLEASPFNNDVIQRFKFCYQKQLLQFVVSQLSAHQESVLTIAGCVSLLECCLWINQAVGQIYPSVVKKAFFKSLPGHVTLSDLEESDDNSGSESIESETQSGYSVEEELEFQTLIGIVLTSLNSSIPPAVTSAAAVGALDSSLGSASDDHLKSDNDARLDGSSVSSSPGNCDGKVRRVELTLQEKVELLRIHHHNGKSQRQLAQMFGIGKSQAHSILKRKDEILDHYENNANLARKRICRRAENDDVNRLTLEWYTEVSKLVDIPITGPMVQEKAKRIAAELGRSDFKASNGWLDSFRKRNNIVFFFSRGANNSVPEESIEDISISFPSSGYSSSLEHPQSRPNQCKLSAAAIHGQTVSPASSDVQGIIKKEPVDADASEKPGGSELVGQSEGHKETGLPDSDSDDDDDDDDDTDSDSDSDKSRPETDTEKTASTQTPYTLPDKNKQEKPDSADNKKKLSLLERSSIETFHKAAVMARELRLFCEDKNLTQLSVMLDFVERQLQIKHIGIV